MELKLWIWTLKDTANKYFYVNICADGFSIIMVDNNISLIINGNPVDLDISFLNDIKTEEEYFISSINWNYNADFYACIKMTKIGKNILAKRTEVNQHIITKY